MKAVLGARAGRTSTAETATAAGRRLLALKRERLDLTHAIDRAALELAGGIPARSVAVRLADYLDGFLGVAVQSDERRAA